jgi:hypothetical protein
MSDKTAPEEASLAATGETPQLKGKSAEPDSLDVKALAQSQTTLQDILPEINDLAGKVGGMDRLAEIVHTLQTSKE